MKDACWFMHGSSNQSKVALMSERFNPPFVDYLYFYTLQVTTQVHSCNSNGGEERVLSIGCVYA
jgi:hypothetical protein